MKIAIVSPEFPPLTNWGGIATFNQELAKLLGELGHEVVVFTFDNFASLQKSKLIDGIRVNYIPFTSSNNFFNFIYSFLSHLFFSKFKGKFPDLGFLIEWNLFFYLYFTKFSKLNTFDLIHTPSYFLPTLLWNFLGGGIPIVTHIQGTRQEIIRLEESNFERRFLARMENFYIKKYSKAIITCNEKFATELKKSLGLENNIYYIPNFTSLHNDNSLKKVDRNKIVFLGRLEYRKGVDLLIRAFATLAKGNKKIELWMLGEDTGYIKWGKSTLNFGENLKRMNVPNSILQRIHLIPRINDRKKLVEQLKKIKGIAVFPSRYEPFGYVIIEAMALGFIVITTSEAAENNIIIDKENGFLIEPTFSSLHHQLKSILKKDQSYFRKIVVSSQKHITENFSYHAVAKDYKKVYQSLKL